MRYSSKQLTRVMAIALCFLTVPCCMSLFGQYRGNPVKKDKLVNVLRSRQHQTREIVSLIKSNGVDFRVTQPVEVELMTAGARPEVIAAAKANYRGDSPATAVSKKPAKTKFSGKPLGKDAIITLLDNGVADAQVRKNVEARGVSFKPTSRDKTDIKSAGGSPALLNLIAASYVDTGGTNSGTVAASGNDDDDIVDSTVSQDARVTQTSINTLQQALQKNPNQARHYQQLGYMYLYGQKNFAEAERYMREAINRGGSAVFRVFHSHDATMQESCQGSLFIAQDAVRFESDNNVHTFETSDANIKKVEMQSVWRSMFKTRKGTFKMSLKSGEKDSVGYVFAPLTDDPAESKMIIRLVGKK